MADPAFKRILLKLSGEALMGELEYGTDPERVAAVARQVERRARPGVEVAIVVGAGNIYRGMKGAAEGMDRATADYMGMLATVLNALPLQDALEKIGHRHARAVGAGRLRGRRALHPPPRDAPPGEGPRGDLRGRHRQPVLHDRHRRGAARGGDPRGDHPDGQERRARASTPPIPRLDPDATFIPEITHMEAIERRLRVMDSTALALCMENSMPLNVFNMDDETSIARIISGERVGTLVSRDATRAAASAPRPRIPRRSAGRTAWPLR